MLRFPLIVVAAIAFCAPSFAADPGPQLPLLRRPSAAPASPAPKAPTQDKIDTPNPISPPPAGASQGVSQERTEGAEVDVAEVQRRGDHVTRAGRGPMGASDRTIGDAMAPPPDDSHKWFISIVTEKGDKESEALLYDLKHSPQLRAWANVEEQKESWAHVTIYVKGDESQDWRWKNLRITRYPTMILQPPAKLLDESKPDSWAWGDPKTVVWQWDGYDSTQPERAKLRADALRSVVVAYCGKVNASRERFATNDRPSPGPKQSVAKPSDNTGAPVFPQLPNFPGSNPVLADPTNPSGPTQAPAGGLSLLLTALGMLGTGTGLNNLLMMALIGVQLFRTFRKSAGQPTLLDDESFAALINALKSLTGQKPNP